MRKSPEKQQERERVRMTLMRATLDLADAHGFSGLGLREISREAGIAPTSFYRHFADVEELGLGIVERLVGPRLATVAEAALATSYDPVQPTVDGLFDTTLEDPALVRFILGQHSGSHASFRRELRACFEPLLAALAPVMPEGAPTAAPTAALSFILLGCDQLLEVASDERPALRTALAPRVAHTTRWLLRCRPVGEADHG